MTDISYLDTSPTQLAVNPLYLVVLGTELRRHPLPKTGEVIIGRDADCAIQIDDPSVSRRHAVLAVGDAGFTVRDLGSSNGTHVRGHRIDATPTVLALDEIIQLGSASIVIHRVGAVRAAEPADPVPQTPKLAPRAVGSPMDNVRALLDRIAAGTISVLILGETGVGKEVLAEAVHHRSPRAAHSFLRLNCAALSETLLESELFGYEKGAFTGADRTKVGLLESADGGTVFLDEIGEMPMATQVKLLRVIEQREVMRVGGLAPRPINVRFVAATHRDLSDEIVAGRFRQDLYFRLNGITLAIPPLRERLGELDSLMRLFLERSSTSLGFPMPALSPEALQMLRDHRWPGNIRELRNVIERAVLLASGGRIHAEHIVLERERAGSAPPPVVESSPLLGSLRDLRRHTAVAERERILCALADAAGNQKIAAALLGISRRTLSNKLDQYAIARPRKGVRSVI